MRQNESNNALKSANIPMTSTVEVQDPEMDDELNTEVDELIRSSERDDDARRRRDEAERQLAAEERSSVA